MEKRGIRSVETEKRGQKLLRTANLIMQGRRVFALKYNTEEISINALRAAHLCLILCHHGLMGDLMFRPMCFLTIAPAITGVAAGAVFEGR